jgi:hypothetical protein
MNANGVTSQLDGVLKPLGFERQQITWNRKSGSFIEVVDVQVSKTGDAITVNAGVLHSNVYAKCWDGNIPKSIEEPYCTVRCRIGELIDGHELWWQLDADNVAGEIAKKVSTHVLPFLEQMHSVDAMERFLTNADVVKRRYPLPIIYLAVLKHEQGDADAACSLLDDLKKKTVGAWQGRISQIRDKLSCA